VPESHPVTSIERRIMKIVVHLLRKSLLAGAAAAALVACSDEEGSAPLTLPDLGSCQKLAVSDTLQLVSRLFAKGVQIYRWNGAAWDFISPSAVLTDDATGRRTVAIHYSGPTWEDLGGSKVVGGPLDNCAPDANAIPWLTLTGVSNGAAGEFEGVTRIQRLHTTGGKAPAAGTTVGQVASVAYTTEYYFYAPR
jgi:uncharacterized protein DUF3455